MSNKEEASNSLVETKVIVDHESVFAAPVLRAIKLASPDVATASNSSLQDLVRTASIQITPLDQNPAAIYLTSLRPVGRRGMRRALAAIVETIKGEPGDPLDFPWHTLRFQHTQALRAKLAERYRPATVNHMLSALRGVLSQAENLGLISADDFRRTTKLKGIRSETFQKGRSLAEEEIKLLLKTCQKDATIKGVRDLAVVAVLYGAGLRRSEIVKLDLKDFEPKENSLKIRSGKGGKDRLTYLSQGAGAVLVGWLKVRGEEAGPLFLPINKADKVMKRRLSDQAVLSAL